MGKNTGARRAFTFVGIGLLLAFNLACHKVDRDPKAQARELPLKTTSPSPTPSVQSELERSAQDFFQFLEAKDYAQAYDCCGGMLKKDLDPAAFEALVKEVGLDNTKELNWTGSEPSPPGLSLNGNLKLSNGGGLDIELVLQEVEDRWLIQGLNFRSQALAKPDHEASRKLVQGSLQSLAAYMDQGNLEPFLEGCASNFADELRSKNILDPYLKKFGEPARFFFLLNEGVVFTAEPPAEDRVLILEGRTEPNEQKEYLYFKLFYVPESNRWALQEMDLWIRGPKDEAPKVEVSF